MKLHLFTRKRSDGGTVIAVIEHGGSKEDAISMMEQYGHGDFTPPHGTYYGARDEDDAEDFYLAIWGDY